MQPIATFLVAACNINMLLSSTNGGIRISLIFGAVQPKSLIRLCTKPVTIRKDRRNKDLIIKQHWMATSEYIWFRPCLPFWWSIIPLRSRIQPKGNISATHECSVICGPIGCAVDFVCRLLHLKIISLKKPLQIGLCNKASFVSKIFRSTKFN